MDKLGYDKKIVNLLNNPIIDHNDLSFLVDIVLGENETNKLSIEKARFSVDNATKKALKNIKKYDYYNNESIILLVYEFQSLSSDSILNVAKKISSKELKPYKDIKKDIFSAKQLTDNKLGEFFKKVSIADKKERKQMILQFIDAICKGHQKFSQKIKNIDAKKMALYFVLGGAYGVALSFATSYNESVAVPFVIQIEWIKYCVKNGIYRQSNFDLIQKEVSANNKFFSVTECPSIEGDILKDLKHNKLHNQNLIKKFSTLLRETSANYSNINRMVSDYVIIDIPFNDLVDSRAVDEAKRAFTKDVNGKIAEHANLTKASSTTAIASSALNIASLVVGQCQLAEINNKLRNIDEKIDFLTKLNFSEDRQIIKNYIQDLQRRMDVFTEANRINKIEILSSIQKKTEIQEIISKYEEQSQNLLDELKGIEKSIWGSDDLTDKISVIQERYKVFSDIIQLGYSSLIVLGVFLQAVNEIENNEYSDSLKLLQLYFSQKLVSQESIFIINNKVENFIPELKTTLSSVFQKNQTDLANYVTISSSLRSATNTVDYFSKKCEQIIQNGYIPNQDVKLLGKLSSNSTLEDIYLVPEKEKVI